MAREFFNDLPDTSTPLNATRLNGLLNGEEALGSIVVDDISCKNMLDTKNGFTNQYITSEGVISSSTVDALFAGYIAVKPNTIYTYSASSSIRNINISEYNSSKTFIQRNVAQNTSKHTFTTTANTYFVRVTMSYEASTTVTQAIIDSVNLQFELGSDRTNYVPYKNFGYETGNNSNGSYIKYDDGTMICYGNYSMSTTCSTALTNGGYRNSGGSTSLRVTYPQEFISAPSVTTTTTSLNCIGCKPDSPTTTYFTALFVTINSESSATTKTANYVAIGRWK